MTDHCPGCDGDHAPPTTDEDVETLRTVSKVLESVIPDVRIPAPAPPISYGDVLPFTQAAMDEAVATAPPVRFVHGPPPDVVAQLDSILELYRQGKVGTIALAVVSKDGNADWMYCDFQGGTNDLARALMYVDEIKDRLKLYRK